MEEDQVKHTPGPWEYDSNHSVVHGTPRYIKAPAGYEGNQWNEVCHVQSFFNYDSREYLRSKIEANARLIAAAPELLEALIELSHQMKEMLAFYGANVSAVSAAKKADSLISKAKGESE